MDNVTSAARRACLREPGLLTVKEAAQQLGIAYSTARNRLQHASIEPRQCIAQILLYDAAAMRRAISVPLNGESQPSGGRLCDGRGCVETVTRGRTLCARCEAAKARARNWRAATLAEAEERQRRGAEGSRGRGEDGQAASAECVEVRG